MPQYPTFFFKTGQLYLAAISQLQWNEILNS